MHWIYEGTPQQVPSCVNWLHSFGACFYKNISETSIKTSVFVNLKGSENKELNYVPPNV